MSTGLKPIRKALGLSVPEFDSAPGSIAPGHYLWSVSAFLPDGQVIESEVFTLEVR
jgi:hypothetical protein